MCLDITFADHTTQYATQATQPANAKKTYKPLGYATDPTDRYATDRTTQHATDHTTRYKTRYTTDHTTRYAKNHIKPGLLQII